MPTYFITGTSRGIGLEYVRQLSKTPDNTIYATVRSLSSDHSELKALNTHSNIHILECEFSSEASIGKLADAIPAGTQFDYIINNAAIQQSQSQKAFNLGWDLVLSHVTSNALGPAKVVQTLLPFIKPGGNAVVVNITSGMGSLGLQATGKIPPHILPYCISKASLNMLTVHQAFELKGKAIVVCVDPGHVKTQLGGDSAPLEVDESAGGVLKVVHGLQSSDSGKYLLYDGKELPW